MENFQVAEGGNPHPIRVALRALRLHWLPMILIFAACLAGAYGWVQLQTPAYRSTASGLVTIRSDQDQNMSLALQNLAASKSAQYAKLAQSVDVANSVKKDLGLEASTSDLLSRVSSTNDSQSNEIKISAEAPSGEDAHRLAAAWLVALQNQVTELEGTGAGSAQVLTLGQADPPTVPSTPNLKIALGAGALLGILLAVVYAFLWMTLDRKIRTSEVLEQNFPYAILGTIPADRRLNSSRQVLATEDAGRSRGAGRSAYAYAEAIRELRTNLRFINVDNAPNIVVITSSRPGEGKSTVAANLASAVARAGRRTVLVDADLRRPRQAEIFQMLPEIGITDVLTGQAEIEEVIQISDQEPNLRLLGSGSTPPNPSELLGSKAMAELLKTLGEDNFVIVDAPPLLPVTDPAIIAHHADGAIVVVSAGKTKVEELKKAEKNLRRVGAKVLGLALNGVPQRGAGAAQYGYYGRSYYGEDRS